MLMEAYHDNALSETICRDWFRRFKDGNFDLSDKKRENRHRKVNSSLSWTRTIHDRKKMLVKELGVTLAAIYMRLRAMGKIQKIGKWVPHELNYRRMERRQNTYEILLAKQKRKSFLHQILTGDEKWINFDNPKRKKSWVHPGQPSTCSPRPNRIGLKTTLCVWWDQQGIVYHWLLKPDETVDTHRITNN